MSDTLTRVIFDDYNIRGVAVHISDDIESLIAAHNYPEPIAKLVLEAAVINAMLCTTLKFEGRITLQLQTNGTLTLLVVQTDHELNYRAVARLSDETVASDISFSDLTENGQLIITIEPDKGQRYQGIVALEGDSLVSCIENYFVQSEQLQTRLMVFSNSHKVFGLLLQALPDLSSQDDFQHLEMLATTLSAEEALSLTVDDILHRLFHQEAVRQLAQQQITYRCHCSREKMLASLELLPEHEITEILQQDGHIEMQCEFCLNQFQFSELDIKSFGAFVGNQTQH